MSLLRLALTVALLVPAASLEAQQSDREAVRQAMLDYIDGFYTGDSTLLVRSVSPAVVKYGYWKADGAEQFVGEPMSYQQIVRRPNRPPRARPDAPREVTVLDVESHVASGKIRAWWGIDYMLLAREEGRWVIRAVLWQGPLETVSAP